MFRDVIKKKDLEVIVLRKAVWHSRGKYKFVMTNWGEGGYVAETRDLTRGVEVEGITLDDVLAFSIGRTIIKMDIEGAEVPVLRSSKHIYKASKLAIEAHGREVILAKMLREQGYKCRIVVYKLNPRLFREWLKVEPKMYGFIIATYRFLVSSIYHPTITVLKAVKKS